MTSTSFANIWLLYDCINQIKIAYRDLKQQKNTLKKEDRVHLVDNRPSTNKLQNFEKKRKNYNKKTDRWIFSQNFISPSLTVWDLWSLENCEEKDQSVSHLINYKAVWRTASATPGLLKTD